MRRRRCKEVVAERGLPLSDGILRNLTGYNLATDLGCVAGLLSKGCF